LTVLSLCIQVWRYRFYVFRFDGIDSMYSGLTVSILCIQIWRYRFCVGIDSVYSDLTVSILWIQIWRYRFWRYQFCVFRFDVIDSVYSDLTVSSLWFRFESIDSMYMCIQFDGIDSVYSDLKVSILCIQTWRYRRFDSVYSDLTVSILCNQVWGYRLCVIRFDVIWYVYRNDVFDKVRARWGTVTGGLRWPNCWVYFLCTVLSLLIFHIQLHH
jgi:hypothetical protein